jgi:hypothetical protein
VGVGVVREEQLSDAALKAMAQGMPGYYATFSAAPQQCVTTSPLLCYRIVSSPI